jgi:hypothetical protein
MGVEAENECINSDDDESNRNNQDRPQSWRPVFRNGVELHLRL